MENIIRAIKVICLISIIYSIPLIVRNREVIEVDKENRYIVERNLKEYVKSTKFISKVSFDRVWLDAVWYVHYSYGKVKMISITEGMGGDEEWVKLWEEHSYQERDRGFIIAGSSLAVLIILRKLRKSKV